MRIAAGDFGGGIGKSLEVRLIEFTVVRKVVVTDDNRFVGGVVVDIFLEFDSEVGDFGGLGFPEIGHHER